ncbi:hypothetical protein EYZ11_005931 [Aspergillus tanneri]|uniref:Uncharacterized protein n=1 Tax=Aspergillus tanneri TaxID=1220188 RepID=A0A4S3JJ93_9EURO|nr:hypothetical protein EYZ11_005931 [Aspergillus tanneri]
MAYILNLWDASSTLVYARAVSTIIDFVLSIFQRLSHCLVSLYLYGDLVSIAVTGI